jgi:hypothetical protein
MNILFLLVKNRYTFFTSFACELLDDVMILRPSICKNSEQVARNLKLYGII